MKIEKVAVVVAHPDDEVLGCYGFIKKLIAGGKQVFILYLNSGCDLREDYDKVEIRNQIKNVCAGIGVTEFAIGDYETAAFEKYPQAQFNSLVNTYLKKWGIDTVLTHDVYDLHKDHRIVHEAVMVASRFKPDSTVKNVITFPVISSSDISPKWKFAPNFYVDVSEHIQGKVETMKLYRTEYREMTKHRGEDGIKIWGKFFGLQSNYEYAEAYTIIRACYE